MPTGVREEPKEYLVCRTEELKLISDYAKLDFEQCLELDCITYRMLFRDAFIYDMKQSKEGREYLHDCYLSTQTKPERQKLRQRFGGVNE